MSIETRKFLEYTFFFIILAGSGYLVWQLFTPFIGAIALAAIIVTICYPLYERILKHAPRKNKGIAAFVALISIVVLVFLPLVILSSFILREALSVYALFDSAKHLSFIDSLNTIERTVQTIIPNFNVNVAAIAQQTTGFIAEHLVSIFAGTASTLFLTFITLISVYYFFRDGKYFTEYLIRLSPLKDSDDKLILARLATAVRSVAFGTVFVAILQGIVTTIGLVLFGFDRAILWGCLAAIGALIPGVGTSIVIIPAIAYLFFTGAHVAALGLTLWGAFAVGLIDNTLGPYVMSRGNKIHPLLILFSVLGGILLFGPIGFILGPVILSLFLVLLEMYHTQVSREG